MEGCPIWRPRREEEILLLSITVASWFLDLILPVPFEVGRREKDEVCPTWWPRRGEEILLMSLTVASCFLDLIIHFLNWGREEGEGWSLSYLEAKKRGGDPLVEPQPGLLLPGSDPPCS
jgi:hypothetical protein